MAWRPIGFPIALDGGCLCLDVAVSRRVMHDMAFQFCAFVYHNGQRSKLALDLAQYMHCTLANDFADHSRAVTDSNWSADTRSADIVAAGRRDCCDTSSVISARTRSK
jgi:hypothetical protein